MYPIILAASLSLWATVLFAQPIPSDSLFLGQTPPGRTPQIFNLFISAHSFGAERIAISDDGKNIYYQELDGYSEMDGKPHTVRSKYYSFENGTWNGPFTLFDSLIAPAFSITGDTMYLQRGVTEAYYSTKSAKTKHGWSTPKRLLSGFKITHYLQTTRSGNYYISALPTNTIGGLDRSRLFINGTDTTVSSLGVPLNTPAHDFDYFVPLDESYMIVTTQKGLAISYHKNDGSWTNPKNFGEAINFGLNEWGPYVTKDNKYLFYTTGTKPDYSDTYIYWVSIGNLIDSLKQTNYTPYVKNNIQPQSTTVGNEFHYTLPELTFIDDDGNTTLTYSATRSDSSPLPAWLKFENATQTFSGTPTEADSLTIRVIAVDNQKASAECEFGIRIEEGKKQ